MFLFLLMDQDFIVSEGYNTKRFRTPRKEKPIIVCAHCAQLISEHKRCTSCDILLHTESFPCKHCGVDHTLSSDGDRCLNCHLEREDKLQEVEFKD